MESDKWEEIQASEYIQEIYIQRWIYREIDIYKRRHVQSGTYTKKKINTVGDIYKKIHKKGYK